MLVSEFKDSGYLLRRNRQINLKELCNLFSARWDFNSDPEKDEITVNSINGRFYKGSPKSDCLWEYSLNLRQDNQSHSYYNAGESKLRWDKVVLVTGEPPAVIFLLGISRTILYCPIPEMNAHLNRDEEFAVEIYSHDVRITALSMSCDGTLLTSGDEGGNLKLHLIKDPTKTRSDYRRKLLAEEESNGLVRCHEGPVYSVQWVSKLPLVVQRDSRSCVFIYSLASGSNDSGNRLTSCLTIL